MTGVQNTASRAGALPRNTIGNNNTASGLVALQSNTTGSGNTASGAGALSNNTTGTNNTAIGAFADVPFGVGNLTNATAIGANAVVSASNALVLGGTGASAVNVGIGLGSPTFRLHVIDPANTGLRVETNTAGGTVASFGGLGEFQVDAPGKVGGRLIIKENGTVGIGTATPATTLQVVGDIRVGSSGTNGCVQNFAGTPLVGTCSSDVRLKKNMRPFPAVLARLVQLQPVHFNWKAAEYPDYHFGPARSSGLIAQEVEKVFPELVTEDTRGGLGSPAKGKLKIDGNSGWKRVVTTFQRARSKPEWNFIFPAW